MADMIGAGLAYLNTVLTESASVTVTYRRSYGSVDLLAVVETPRTNPLSVLAGVVAGRDMRQQAAEAVDHDFSFAAADLILADELTTPEDGDTIERTIDGVLTVYKIVPSRDGERMWKYLTGYEAGDAARILVHGRLKSVI